MTRPPVGYAYMGDGVGLTLTHRGHQILVYTKDFGLSPHIIMHGHWERAVEEAVLRQVPEGGTVVEVGCNMGYHTLAMSEKLGPTGKLYGFEANPEIFRLLRWTLDLNGFLGPAKIFNHAVTDSPGELQFQYEPIAVGGGNIVSGNLKPGAVVINVKGEPLDTTLPDLSNVDVLRMDAEGAEPQIVKSGLGIVDRSPNITIITEWSVNMMSRRTDVPGFIQLMAGRGFRAWRVQPDASLAPVDDLLALPHCEVVFCRGEPK